MYSNGLLLFRPDKAAAGQLCLVLHPTTLAVIGEVLLQEKLAAEYEFFTFVGDSHHVCLVSATKVREMDMVPVTASTYVILQPPVEQVQLLLKEALFTVTISTEPSGSPCLVVTTTQTELLNAGDCILQVNEESVKSGEELMQKLTSATTSSPEAPTLLLVRRFTTRAKMVYSSLLQLTADHTVTSQPDKQMTSCGMSLQVQQREEKRRATREIER